MRYIKRIPLEVATQEALQSAQAAVDAQRATGTLDIQNTWKNARQKKILAQEVVGVLERMVGDDGPCMYCMHNIATDIDHFRPKSRYPDKLFVWPNMLWCCGECGGFKGSAFPLNPQGEPLLLDPTAMEPWEHLDFDPRTGNLTARFIPADQRVSPIGQETVSRLHLDRREALANRYKKTFKRLAKIVDAFLDHPSSVTDLADRLIEADDHGLLCWCFVGTGGAVEPFSLLQKQHPAAWQRCKNQCQRR
ncbi:MAG: hypothetical protein HQM03_18910 [Magnetococcales bacterium]|nr:hypothetical protein [Magnetococcales bacterium]